LTPSPFCQARPPHFHNHFCQITLIFFFWVSYRQSAPSNARVPPASHPLIRTSKDVNRYSCLCVIKLQRTSHRIKSHSPTIFSPGNVELSLSSYDIRSRHHYRILPFISASRQNRVIDPRQVAPQFLLSPNAWLSRNIYCAHITQNVGDGSSDYRHCHALS
jgi:hypothetical protein